MKDFSVYKSSLIDIPVQSIKDKLTELQNAYSVLTKSKPTNIEDYPYYMKSLEDLKTKVSELQFDLSSNAFMQAVQIDQAKEKEDFLTAGQEAFESVDAEIQSKVIAIQDANRLHNQQLVDNVALDNIIFDELKQLQGVLLEYSSAVTDYCARYGITSSDINVELNYDNAQELKQLYKSNISMVRKAFKNKLNIVDKFTSKFTNPFVQGLIILITFLLLKTPVGAILTVALLGGIIYESKVGINRAKKFGIVQALMYNVNVDTLQHSTVDSSDLLPEEIPEEDWDNYPELSAIGAKYEQAAQRYDEEAFDVKAAEEFESIMKMRPQFEMQLNRSIEELTMIKKGLLEALDAFMKEQESVFALMKEEWKPFYQRFSSSKVLDTKFVFGSKELKEEFYDMTESNVIIRPNGSVEDIYSFIRLLIINAFVNVHPHKCFIHVFDPNDRGQVVMPLYRADMAEKIEICTGDVSEVLNRMGQIAAANMKLMGGYRISEFNAECDKTGRDSIPYDILIIVSQPDDVKKREEIKALLDYSFDEGVPVWIVSKDLEISNATTFNMLFPVQSPFREQDNLAWCHQFMEDYKNAIEKAQPAAVEWSNFIEKVCPKEKTWTFNADDNLLMHPGFENGDPFSPTNFPLGNGGNVHALGVGTTGAGKSVFLNHMIMTLTRMYSPRELQLWLCDFKGTEFQFYMSKPEHPNVLPHLKACLCTSDGAYATSLFNAVRRIVDQRFDQMKDPNADRSKLAYDPGGSIPNQDGAKNWNGYWRQRAETELDDRMLENCYPRILLLCDEFQAIFEKADDKSLEKINEDMTQIAKLGRAANVHMFFTSQTMKGTLKADTLNQFTLRMVLRSDLDTSTSILGCDKSAKLPRFGFLYVNATQVLDKKNPPKFATPGISKPEVVEQTNYLAQLAIEQSMPKYDVITYEEGTKHPIEELEGVFESLSDNEAITDDLALFIFGPRMTYSTNKVPDNTLIQRKNNENMFSIFNEYSDFVLFFNLIMANARLNKNKPTIIINSQVEDLLYITDAESYLTLPDAHSKNLRLSCQEMLEWMGELQAQKEEHNSTKPVWIILLGWDKGTGFGVDGDMMLKRNLGNFLQTCGTSNIHVFMINTNMVGMTETLKIGFKYLIAGKVSQSDSSDLLQNKCAGIPYEMKTGWIFVKRDGMIQRDKLYISKVEREIAANEIIIT